MWSWVLLGLVQGLEERERQGELVACAGECLEGWVGDGVCNEACNVEACGFDDGDCDSFPIIVSSNSITL